MSNHPPPEVGTAFFPDVDMPPNGADHGELPARHVARLRSLPRRRRPMAVALGAALVGAGVLASAGLYEQADHEVAVVMVVSAVPAGAQITAGDVSVTQVTVGAGEHVIPAAQLGQVSGEMAAVSLLPGTLLARADLTTSRSPGPGQQLVPVAIKPSLLPASGLAVGDQVLIVATPGDQGMAGSQTGAQPLAAPVAATVEAVTGQPDPDGLDVVDLLVAAANGTAVAEQASTGQFAIIVTKRGD